MAVADDSALQDALLQRAAEKVTSDVLFSTKSEVELHLISSRA